MTDCVHLGYAGLGSGTGKRVAPRFFLGSVPRVGVRTVKAMPVIRAFNNGAVVH